MTDSPRKTKSDVGILRQDFKAVFTTVVHDMGFHVGSEGKESACHAGDLGVIPGSGKPPEEGTSNPLQYSYLDNSMDRRAWWAIVHRLQRVRQDWATITFR